jgi:transketolase
MDSNLEQKIRILSDKLRKRALLMAFESGNNGSHLGGGLSTIEIFATLYGGFLRVNSKDATNPSRDRMIVSKGHCVLAYYTVLNEFGFLSEKELKSFEVNGSGLHGHASRFIEKGIEFSGGSLGLGLSYAIGVALAGKMNKIPYHVYVIIGDGECNEGIVWESIMSASHYKLDNLTIIVDRNKLQYDGECEEVMSLGNLQRKFEAFGMDTYEVEGHNINELYTALSGKSNLPKAIIANTIKGKGVSFMENKKEWHHSRLSKEQYEIAISEQPA